MAFLAATGDQVDRCGKTRFGAPPSIKKPPSLVLFAKDSPSFRIAAGCASA
jgi:hypothetical protein